VRAGASATVRRREGLAARKQADFPRPAGEPAPRNRARRRMAGTDLKTPKLGSDRSEVPF